MAVAEPGEATEFSLSELAAVVLVCAQSNVDCGSSTADKTSSVFSSWCPLSLLCKSQACMLGGEIFSCVSPYIAAIVCTLTIRGYRKSRASTPLSPRNVPPTRALSGAEGQKSEHSITFATPSIMVGARYSGEYWHIAT